MKPSVTTRNFLRDFPEFQEGISPRKSSGGKVIACCEHTRDVRSRVQVQQPAAVAAPAFVAHALAPGTGPVELAVQAGRARGCSC